MTFFANTKKDDETLKTLKDNLSSKIFDGFGVGIIEVKDVKEFIKRQIDREKRSIDFCKKQGNSEFHIKKINEHENNIDIIKADAGEDLI